MSRKSTRFVVTVARDKAVPAIGKEPAKTVQQFRHLVVKANCTDDVQDRAHRAAADWGGHIAGVEKWKARKRPARPGFTRQDVNCGLEPGWRLAGHSSTRPHDGGTPKEGRTRSFILYAAALGQKRGTLPANLSGYEAIAFEAGQLAGEVTVLFQRLGHGEETQVRVVLRNLDWVPAAPVEEICEELDAPAPEAPREWFSMTTAETALSRAEWVAQIDAIANAPIEW